MLESEKGKQDPPPPFLPAGSASLYILRTDPTLFRSQGCVLGTRLFFYGRRFCGSFGSPTGLPDGS